MKKTKRMIAMLVGGLAGALGGYGFMYGLLEVVPRETRVKLPTGQKSSPYWRLLLQRWS